VLGTFEEQVAELVEQLHGRTGASALCDLTSLGTPAISLVAGAYDRETQPSGVRLSSTHCGSSVMLQRSQLSRQRFEIRTVVCGKRR